MPQQFPPEGRRLTAEERDRLRLLELQLRIDDPALARALCRGPRNRQGFARSWLITFMSVTLLAFTVTAFVGGIVLGGSVAVSMIVVGWCLHRLGVRDHEQD
jgi:hypothetical protein